LGAYQYGFLIDNIYLNSGKAYAPVFGLKINDRELKTKRIWVAMAKKLKQV
jgi:hypothetical protein